MNREICPSRDLLLAYETAELPESSVQPLIAHISECPACQADLETICAIDDTLIARLREPPAIDPYEAEPECWEAVLRMQQLATQACGVRGLPNAGAPPRRFLILHWSRPIRTFAKRCPSGAILRNRTVSTPHFSLVRPPRAEQANRSRPHDTPGSRPWPVPALGWRMNWHHRESVPTDLRGAADHGPSVSSTRIWRRWAK
jgi:anti-sigma factor RsiW